MPDHVLRDPLPEDALSDLECEVRVSAFTGFLQQLKSMARDRSVGPSVRAAAKHLPSYVKLRIDLPEFARRYPGR